MPGLPRPASLGERRDFPLEHPGVAALTGRFKLAGPSLAAVGDPLGVTLPTTPAFSTRGALVKDGKLWKAVFDEARIGSSQPGRGLSIRLP